MAGCMPKRKPDRSSQFRSEVEVERLTAQQRFCRMQFSTHTTGPWTDLFWTISARTFVDSFAVKMLDRLDPEI